MNRGRPEEAALCEAGVGAARLAELAGDIGAKECGTDLKNELFRTIVWPPRSAVTMAPFIATMRYGRGSKGGVNLFFLDCRTRTRSPVRRDEGATLRRLSA